MRVEVWGVWGVRVGGGGGREKEGGYDWWVEGRDGEKMEMGAAACGVVLDVGA